MINNRYAVHDKIKKAEVHLIPYKITQNISDATRKVGNIGFTIVKIQTEQGIEGIGVTYHEVGGEAVRTLIEKSIAPYIIGRNPFENQVIWYDLVQYLRGVSRKGLSFCALSAIDLALWDIKGKYCGIPLYQLLGGSKTEIPVYASGGWTSYSDEELVEEMQQMVKDGYKMVKFKVGAEGGHNYQRDLMRVRKVRDALGPEIGIMLDANNCWDSATGVQFANRVKEYDIMFLEEPVFADDIPGLIRYKHGTDLPLASGEHEYTKYGARDLVLSQAVDIIQMDTTRAGGITEMIKVAALTEAFNIKFAPHAMEHIQLHLLNAVPTALFAEKLMLFDGISRALFKNYPVPKDGKMQIPDMPGLGLVLDEDYMKEYEQKD